MPKSWNAEAEARVFACVLALKDIKLSRDDYNQISEMMNGEYSGEAIRQRITKKIKKSFANPLQGEGSSRPSNDSLTPPSLTLKQCEKPMTKASKPTEKPLQFVPFELPAKKGPVGASKSVAAQLNNSPTPKRKRPSLLLEDRDSLSPLDKKSKTENEAEEVDNSLADFEEPETI
ncbi:hypothetical protein IWZ00DRAFT_487556 [Phyllosticta capitalensis]|uniref:Uncharacterized protein n=1 Tax=Phyllosticta capitalensis TaxID=121624 RepID=A0ABR1YRZ0_9PEZI